MKLERRIVYWIDIGIQPYQEIFALQEELLDLRKKKEIPDIVLYGQHPFEINFGQEDSQNKFNDTLHETLSQEFGEDYSLDQAKSYLATKDIIFSKTSRGGGATVLAPGQVVFYPIVDISKITRKEVTSYDISATTDYKNIIDLVMRDSLINIGIEDVIIRQSVENPEGRRDRRDIWIDTQEKSFKIGSKGIHAVGNYAYHGFVLYLEDRGIKPFEHVKPCGYDHNQVSVTSVESRLGNRIPYENLVSSVKSQIQRHFDYDEIQNFSFDDLLKFLEHRQ